MYGTQVFVYSDWIQHVYDLNEFRCYVDTADAVRRLGKEPEEADGLASFRLCLPPFRHAVLAFWKTEYRLSSAEKHFLDTIAEAVGTA